jgi:hypothetical protein
MVTKMARKNNAQTAATAVAVAKELMNDDAVARGVKWQPIDMAAMPKLVVSAIDTLNKVLNDPNRTEDDKVVAKEEFYDEVKKLISPKVDIPEGKEIAVVYRPATLQYGFREKKAAKAQPLRL